MQVRGKIHGSAPNSGEVTERARGFVLALVHHHEDRGGSRMSAYAIVAHGLGVSKRWVTKLVWREPMTLHAHQYLNLIAAYRRLCECIEEDAAHKQREAAQLKGQADAAFNGIINVAPSLDRIEEG